MGSYRWQVRMMLLANGSPLETVNSLTNQEINSLYYMLRQGLWGYTKDFTAMYNGYVSSIGIREAVISAAAGKKYKPTEPKPFHELFPEVDDIITLGHGSGIREANKHIGTLMSLNPPKEILEKLGV